MRISVSIVASDVQVSQDLIQLEVFPDMTLDNVKMFIEDEIRVQPGAQFFMHNQQPVTNTAQALSSLGVVEGDVLSLVIRSNPPTASRQQQPPNVRQPAQPAGQPDTETLRLQILGDHQTLATIRARDPELGEAVHHPQNFARLWTQRQQQVQTQQAEKERMLELLDADPYNMEAQEKIEEIIRQERVMENMQKAMEDNPESFGRVIMLYIDVLVNNTPVKAFVDSGAQTTIMSPDAAERCGIMRLIDRRFGGIARGVGTATILGRVHSADIQIGQYNLASSFTVMEGKDVDLLLGLDMLKRHQMSIDLKDNVLRIREDAVPFLSEHQVPNTMKEAMNDEPTVDGPGNTEIGATTGTVKAKSGSTSASSTAQASSSGSSGPRTQVRSSTNTAPSARAAPATPATPATQSNPAQSQPRSNLPRGVTEQAVAQITEIGFSRAEAIAALEQANGNVEIAIGLLL